MAEAKIPVCRLCLEIIYDNNFEPLRNALTQLQFLLPKLNHNLPNNPVMCHKCKETIQKSVNFKTACLQTKGLVEQEQSKGIVCRICLKLIEGNLYTQLTVQEQPLLDKYFPEMNFNLTQNPFLCGLCMEGLQNHLRFVKSCLDVEDRIKNYFNASYANINNSLHDMLVSSVEIEADSETDKDIFSNFLNKTITANRELPRYESHSITFVKTEEDKDNCDDTSDGLISVKKELPHDDGEEITIPVKHEEVFIKEEASDSLGGMEIVQKVAKTGVKRRLHSFSQSKTNQNRTFETLTEMEKYAIRKKVHEFFWRNEIPTTDKVLKVINADPGLPNLSTLGFYKQMKRLKLKYQKNGRNSMWMDKTDIVLLRRDYLAMIKAYRNENRKLYYLDETWVNAAHITTKGSAVEMATSSKRAFLNALSAGLKNPTEKGKWLIICHVGSANGFVGNGFWTFKSKKLGDYNEDINGKSFEQWFADVLPRLDQNSVIVLDNAPYHCRKVEKIPTMSSKKSDVHNWLRSKKIEFDESMLKCQLIDIVKQHKSQYDKYVIDEMARRQNKNVLRLPPYHCELNPIELIWPYAKTFIARHDTTCKLADVKDLFNRAYEKVTADNWRKCIQYVQLEVESKMWELDDIIETQAQKLNINVAESDDDSDSSSNSSD